MATIRLLGHLEETAVKIAAACVLVQLVHSPAMAWDVQRQNVSPEGKGEFFLCSVANVDVGPLLALGHDKIESVVLCAMCSEEFDVGSASFKLSTSSAPGADYSITSFSNIAYIDGNSAGAIPLSFSVFPNHTSALTISTDVPPESNRTNTLKLLAKLSGAKTSFTLDFASFKLEFNARNAGTATAEFASSCPLQLP